MSSVPPNSPKEETLINFDKQDNSQAQQIISQTTKKSRFEITSVIPSHKDKEKTRRRVALSRINHLKKNRWICTDYKVPGINLIDIIKDHLEIEFYAEKIGILWRFSDTNHMTDANKGCEKNESNESESIKNINVTNRFIVRPTNTETDVNHPSVPGSSLAEKDNETSLKNTIIANKEIKENYTQTVLLDNMEQRSASASVINESEIKSKDLNTAHSVEKEIGIQDFSPIQASISHVSEKNEPKASSLDSKKGDILHEERKIFNKSCPNRMSHEAHTDPIKTIKIKSATHASFPNNNSLKKLTSAQSNVLATLMDQISFLTDHIVELNNTITYFKEENEHLVNKNSKYNVVNSIQEYNLETKLMRVDSAGQVKLLMEIIPGQKRFINITKCLTVEELEYLTND